MNEGYIKIFRSILDWERYDDINTKVLFIHLLLRVNYEDKKWRGILISKGEILTSYGKLALETKLSVKQIRLCLDKLKKTNEIVIKTTNNYTIVKLNNYLKYNLKDTQEDKQKTNEGQTDGKQRATTKERKNSNILNKFNILHEGGKIKKEKYGEFESVLLSSEEYDKLTHQFGEKIIKEYIAKLDERIQMMGNKYKNHYATILSWLRRDGIQKQKVSYVEHEGRKITVNEFLELTKQTGKT